MLFVQFIMQFPCQSLGGKLDRRERIADFMRQPFRHFAPCGFFLGADEDGDVVDHHHHAVVVVVGQDGGFTQENTRIVGCGVFDLDGLGGIGGFFNGGKHFGKQCLLRRLSAPVVPVAAPQRHQFNAQNPFGGFVEGFQTTFGIQSNHARGQAFQHAFEIVARRFFAQAVVLVGFFGDGKLFGHVVEQLGQPAEFVVAEHGAFLAEIALRHRPCTFCQRQYRLDEAAGEIQRHHQGKENRQQRGNQQSRQKEGLQALFGVAQFGVFRPRRFNQRRILRHILRDGLAEKQGVIASVVRADQHPALRVQDIFYVFQTAYRTGLLQLLPSFFVEFGLV